MPRIIWAQDEEKDLVFWLILLGEVRKVQVELVILPAAGFRPLARNQ